LSKIHQAESLADEIVTQETSNLGVGWREAFVYIAGIAGIAGSVLIAWSF
jgi:hypothetical protein